MSWSQIVDDQNGIFGKQFISVYAENLDEVRSVELITIAKMYIENAQSMYMEILRS